MKLLYLYILFSSLSILAAPFQLEEASIESVHTAFKNKQLNCEELVGSYIQRIKLYNLAHTSSKPPINAIVEINTSAFEQARRLDKYFAQFGQFSGPLHCIPIVLKNNIDSYDMNASSGSLSLLANQPIKDAALVDKLRKAGAVLLATASMDEFASGFVGISGRTGRTGNAYDTIKNPGGSSSGSAAAVSANFAMLGVGTDNTGSIRVPAAFNGIAGLRPSTGLISQEGIFPRGNMNGVAGPMARTVADLAIMLEVMAQSGKAYSKNLNASGLQGKRIGILTRAGDSKVLKKISPDNEIEPFEHMSPEIKAKVQKSIDTMQKMGATIVNNVIIPVFDRNDEGNQAGELEDINDYLASYPAVRRDYADICRSQRTATYRDAKECLTRIDKFPKKKGNLYEKALSVFHKNKLSVEAVMDQFHLDALLIPVSQHGVSSYDNNSINGETIASNSGLPGITFTAGIDATSGMPIGIELIGRQFSEDDLIKLAFSYEKNTGPRIPPKMPMPDEELANLDIPTLNNLFLSIGYATYKQILSIDGKNRYRLYRGEDNIQFAAIVVEQLLIFKKKQEGHSLSR